MIEFTEKEIKEIEDFYYSDNFNRKINELGKQFEERYEKFRDSPEKIIEKIKTAFIFSISIKNMEEGISRKILQN